MDLVLPCRSAPSPLRITLDEDRGAMGVTVPERLVKLTHAVDVSTTLAETTASWSIWDSSTHPQSPAGSGKFHHDYADHHEERVLVLTGRARLIPDDIDVEPFTIEAGDFVVFKRGFACQWQVVERMTKRYGYFDEDGEAIADAGGISCDGCGADCWAESHLCKSDDAGQLDICPACFLADKGEMYRDSQLQREGVTVMPAPKKRGKPSGGLAAKGRSKRLARLQ